MREYGFNSSISGSTPHFDDERTLATARQVIPLAKIDAKVRRRRGWFLGGAFAMAMLLGAASALLASYLKLRNVNTSEITQVELTSAPLATAETVITELPTVAAIEEETEFPVVEEPPKKDVITRRRAVTRPEPDYIPSREASGRSEEEELERIRAAVLLDHWEERRMRRAVRRERRQAERANRDLSNLDEIFEGPRRP